MTDPILVTVADAGRILALSSTRVYELARDGVLEKRYVGKGTRNYRLTFASVKEYADSLNQDPVSA